jgi:L-ascorbate metabolism protein UlaG (beta-lactamase superfamily)
MSIGLAMTLFGSAAAAEPASLRWYGHSFFILTSPQGVRVALDPAAGIGYPLPERPADIITVSHEHSDHNRADRLGGSPVILRGLKAGGADWNPVSYRKGDVRITSLPAYHDGRRGRKYGLNSIFIVETGGIRLAHLSDIGNTLSEATVKAMGRIDILMVPVGGRFSIDGLGARKIMARLNPRVTIPIHYKTPVTAKWPIEDETSFLEGLKNVRRLKKLNVSLTPETLPARPEVWVMRYE